MIAPALFWSATVVAAGPSAVAPRDIEAYQGAAASAGRNPDAHVRLALWCEAHGLSAQRLKHLSLALVIDPAHAAARGLLGYVNDQGRWRRVADAVARSRADAARAEVLARYHDRRDQIPDTPEAHRQLAEWCEENELKDEAVVHLTAVVRLNPGRDEAWKKLGYRKQNGRWTTNGQAAAERAEIEAQRRAEAHWRPLLQKRKAALGDKHKRVDAEEALLSVDDPRAVPSIWKVFAAGDEEHQARAVALLRGIDAPIATRALASLAVLGASAQVRKSASEGLAGRDPRAFAPWLIALLREPVVYEVKHVGGPGKPGELYIKGERANLRRYYSAPPPLATLRPGDVLSFDAFGLPVVNRIVGFQTEPVNNVLDPMGVGASGLSGLSQMAGLPALGGAGSPGLQNPRQTGPNAGMMGGPGGAFNTPLVAQVPIGQLMVQAQQQAQQAQRQLETDVANLDAYNKDVNHVNERVLDALRTGLSEEPDRDRSFWIKWWSDLSETRSAVAPRPGGPITSEEPSAAARGLRRPRMPALEGATLVWTLDGQRAVEALRVGDKVLAQDTATGALGFAPVVTVRRAPREPVRTIALDGTTLVATALERFWVPAKGWVPAGELAAGDALRALDGVVKVSAVEESGMRPVYHVALGDARGIFVGQRGLLAHDDGLAYPAMAPFDLPAKVDAPVPARAQ